MLVLTRKTKEEIRIGNDITVTIVRVKGQSVRIGINAPPHVHIIRSELTNDAPTDEQEPGRKPSEMPQASIKTTKRIDPPAAHERPSAGMRPAQRTNPRDAGCQGRFESPLGSTNSFARVVARQRSNP